MLITYCEGEELASAYKATGWQDAGVNRYLSKIKISSGEILSIRDVNRRGGLKKFKKYESIFVSRKKLILFINRQEQGYVGNLDQVSPHRKDHHGRKNAGSSDLADQTQGGSTSRLLATAEDRDRGESAWNRQHHGLSTDDAG